jgi:hypothetical protein
MDMIRHKTISMDTVPVFFYAFLKEEKELAPILFVKKDILTSIAT